MPPQLYDFCPGFVLTWAAVQIACTNEIRIKFSSSLARRGFYLAFVEMKAFTRGLF